MKKSKSGLKLVIKTILLKKLVSGASHALRVQFVRFLDACSTAGAAAGGPRNTARFVHELPCSLSWHRLLYTVLIASLLYHEWLVLRQPVGRGVTQNTFIILHLFNTHVFQNNR